MDLSNATKLKEIKCLLFESCASTFAGILHTITEKHQDLKQVSITPYFCRRRVAPADLFSFPGSRHYWGWDALDDAIVRLLKLHPNCMKLIQYHSENEVFTHEDGMCYFMNFFPNAMKVVEKEGIEIEIEWILC